MEMLAHVNKRLQGQQSIKLPLNALLQLFQSPTATPMTRNFALVYVEMAFKRASAAEKYEVVTFHPFSKQKSSLPPLQMVHR